MSQVPAIKFSAFTDNYLDIERRMEMIIDKADEMMALMADDDSPMSE